MVVLKFERGSTLSALFLFHAGIEVRGMLVVVVTVVVAVPFFFLLLTFLFFLS